MDFEVPFKNHYFEVVDIIGKMFGYIFRELNARFKDELEIVSQQYPFTPFLMNEGEAVRLNFLEGVELLKEAGFVQDPL